MTKHEQEMLEQYLALCKRIYDRMRRENSWPWVTDSQENNDVVESEDNANDI